MSAGLYVNGFGWYACCQFSAMIRSPYRSITVRIPKPANPTSQPGGVEVLENRNLSVSKRLTLDSPQHFDKYRLSLINVGHNLRENVCGASGKPLIWAAEVVINNKRPTPPILGRFTRALGMEVIFLRFIRQQNDCLQSRGCGPIRRITEIRQKAGSPDLHLSAVFDEILSPDQIKVIQGVVRIGIPVAAIPAIQDFFEEFHVFSWVHVFALTEK